MQEYYKKSEIEDHFYDFIEEQDKEWIEENRHLLKPPVGNKAIWSNGEYIVMVVGGPNARKDYHLNETPEFFYQVEGDITLKVIDEGVPKDIHIREGEIYLLPSNIPPFAAAWAQYGRPGD